MKVVGFYFPFRGGVRAQLSLYTCGVPSLRSEMPAPQVAPGALPSGLSGSQVMVSRGAKPDLYTQMCAEMALPVCKDLLFREQV